MARWRPPPPKSSPYITPEGERALKTELRELWHLRRKDVVPALSAAAAEGDRSENAEYIYRKKQLGEIDRRIRYISKRLDVITVVDRIPPQQDKAFFGCFVTLREEGGEIVRYRIVGADEIDRICGDEVRTKGVAAAKDAGFTYVTLDLEGYRTGSMNEVLGNGDGNGSSNFITRSLSPSSPYLPVNVEIFSMAGVSMGW